MTSPITLISGLGGAIGSDFNKMTRQLFFVEYNGKISRLDLTRELDYVVYSGVATMPPDSSLDLTTGASIQGGDIRWDHHSPGGGLVMRPQGNCELAFLGDAPFNSISYADLQELDYSTNALHGNPGPGNQLADGYVFAVHNRMVQPAVNFDYAKVKVLHYGASLKVKWTAYRLKPAYHILGTGYTHPEDLSLSSDSKHAYVTERGGVLLKVDLTHADRSHAQVISSGMNAPHQIFLDEARGDAYVVEYAFPGRMLRINLSTGAQTTLLTGLEGVIGLVMTNDLRFAYITEQTASGKGQLSRVEISSGRREVLIDTLTAPFFLTWLDASEDNLLLTERDPAHRLTMIDVSHSPVMVKRLSSAPFRPSSVAIAGDDFLICSDSVISHLSMVHGSFAVTGPTILGIGHVPFDRIVGGYADTTVDPGYFFQVKDAPFGGVLPLKINHVRAYAEGARYYTISVDGALQAYPWTDYRWSSGAHRFILRTMNPLYGRYFRVRRPGDLWYNPLLGYWLHTTELSNGLHTIEVKLYSHPNMNSLLSADSLQVMIDNNWPTAVIDEILHDGAVVGTCAIVDSGSKFFSFRITADDMQGHLKNWTLRALWGDNKSDTIAADNYMTANPATAPIWHGPISQITPAAPWDAEKPGDPTSTRCAHTFYLTVWDRVINGLYHIHRSHYHKSITIMLL